MMCLSASHIRVNISGNDTTTFELPTASFSLVMHSNWRIVCNNRAGFGKNFSLLVYYRNFKEHVLATHVMRHLPSPCAYGQVVGVSGFMICLSESEAIEI